MAIALRLSNAFVNKVFFYKYLQFYCRISRFRIHFRLGGCILWQAPVWSLHQRRMCESQHVQMSRGLDWTQLWNLCRQVWMQTWLLWHATHLYLPRCVARTFVWWTCLQQILHSRTLRWGERQVFIILIYISYWKWLLIGNRWTRQLLPVWVRMEGRGLQSVCPILEMSQQWNWCLSIAQPVPMPWWPIFEWSGEALQQPSFEFSP